uniref:Potassium transporter n=1 Tax=Kalanchoe fedtschenkoi TaxID=63787 RepID=A0A7N0V0S4_KALFE
MAQPATEEGNLGAEKGMNDRKVSWGKLRRADSLNLEAGKLSYAPSHASKVTWMVTLHLAFQSIGVVYGDIGTSPLYVFSSTFSDGIKNKEDIYGVLSLIIYTLILIPLIKYVFIVLSANDNGDGGTFALYSLICRFAKISLIPNQQAEDSQVSNYRLDTPSNRSSRLAHKVKEKLENSKPAKMAMFLVTILGTSMVIGDGVLTPSISVLSAVGGISALSQDAIVGLSIAILIILFSVQRFGTDKVGYTFAPIVALWFAFISGIGLYNLFKYNLGVFRAFNPKYIIDYFRRNGKDGWISLGGVVLCITGTEAMFADLGHFSVRSIQISFSGIVFPALVVAYSGQAAYLTKFPEHVGNTFYDCIPGPLYWPTFVVAVGASIIASQAMISGAFSIISQSLSLGCFPRVKVVHTSAKYEGQVYIPEVNYMLMAACVVVTFAFKTTENIGHAYGIAVVSVMVITTGMVALIMSVIWKRSLWSICLFFVVFIAIEGVYLSSVLYKFTQGGYFPLALSGFLMSVMGVWHYVHRQRYMFELSNKVPSEYLADLAKNPAINRVPGLGLLYSELVQGIPPIFPHFISNIPSVHSVLIFVSIKHMPISKVAVEERFLFRQVGLREQRMFRCVVRYGYKDSMAAEPEEFERQLVGYLKEYIRQERLMLEIGDSGPPDADAEVANIQHSSILTSDGGKAQSKETYIHPVESPPEQQADPDRRVMSSGSINTVISSSGDLSRPGEGAEEEMQFVQRAMERGVVYLLGESEVVAEQNSSIFKQIVVNYAYSFLRKNFRQGEKVMAIPRDRLLRVGMTYEI